MTITSEKKPNGCWLITASQGEVCVTAGSMNKTTAIKGAIRFVIELLNEERKLK